MTAPPNTHEGTVRPVRLQLSRKRGFNLQEHSLTTNGLPALNVARPSKWGNPYKIGTCLIGDATAAVMAFEANLPMSMDLRELRGKNLACFCKLGTPCHADTLLRLANAPWSRP